MFSPSEKNKPPSKSPISRPGPSAPAAVLQVHTQFIFVCSNTCDQLKKVSMQGMDAMKALPQKQNPLLSAATLAGSPDNSESGLSTHYCRERPALYRLVAHATQAMYRMMQRMKPMIEQTKPAVAMPFESGFLRPCAPRTIPIRPTIAPIHWTPARKTPQTREMIPKTKDATPIV